MDIAVIGINHNNSPIEVRERFSFTESMKIESVDWILDKSVEEMTIVSTCNRSEIYVASNNIDLSIEDVKNFYKEYFEFPEAEDYIFVKKGKEAVIHLYIVGAGLDSMVLGEDQILGQIRDAMLFAMDLGCSKKVLNRLFMDAISEGKKIRSEIKISEIPLSTSYIGINLLKEELGSLKGKKALIIGAGEMSTLAIRYLYEEELEEIYTSNRTHGRIKDVSDEFDGLKSIKYDDRYDILKDVDIVITATGAPHTILMYEDMPKLENKLHILDLALPRDVDSKIGNEENISLYHNDDLQKVSSANLLKREKLSEKGLEVINGDVEKFMKWLDTIHVDPFIKSLNQRCNSIKEDTMNYINRKADLNKRDKKIVDKMVMSALRKFIREPIKVLKKVDGKDSEEYVRVMERLFKI